ncbi:MAG: PaaI family thioesterase [Acetobacteraceae bacterium]|nr:PaaI family thioesterase [Acetobacteraceae bacterium]
MPDQPPNTGAPFHDHLGIRIAEWREGYARLICDTVAHHANRTGFVHGGALLSLMDQTAAFAGLFCDQPGRTRHAVTLDLDCRFTAPARLGQRLSAEGRVVTSGRNVFFCRTEIRDAAGVLVAYGSSTHRYREGSGDPR